MTTTTAKSHLDLALFHGLTKDYVPIPPDTHLKPGAGTWERMWHKGSLYSHSIWVASAMCRFFASPAESPLSVWAEGIDRSELPLLCAAGLFHDIGKGGDLKTAYVSKAGHETRGMQLLLGKPQTITFSLAKGDSFDCRQLFGSHWTDGQRSLIAFLVGCHSVFGFILGDIPESRDDDEELLHTHFVKGLKKYLGIASECGVTIGSGESDISLVALIRLACAINAADVMGLCPVALPSTDLAREAGLFPIPAPTAEVNVPKIDELWSHHKYDTRGIAYRSKFLSYVAKPEILSTLQLQGC